MSSTRTEINNAYSECKLPIVTQEEHHEFMTLIKSSQATASISAAATTTTSTAASTPASTDTPPDPSGGNQIDNVFYLNFVPGQQMSTDMQNKLAATTSDVNLNSNFLSVKANAAVQAKIQSGALPNDLVKQANYKVKVISYLAQNTPWIATVGTQTQQKNFTVEKSAFHNALVTTFTNGLSLPDDVASKLEGFLTNVSNVINVASASSDNLAFFILATIYQKDDVAQIWRAYIRTIYFQVDQTLSSYTKSKNSQGTNVNINFNYVQTDGQFNQEFFDANAKVGVQNVVGQGSSDFINNPPQDIPV